jgi:hypothetical protein
MDLLEKLEALKQKGVYSMLINYGEGMGCDDNEVNKLERKFDIIGHPVGYMGEVKIYFKGTVRDFLDFDLNTEPTQVSNPPKEEQIGKAGFYYWGTDRSMESVKNKGKVLPF